jgi:DNA-binding response OmpR family regulator
MNATLERPRPLTKSRTVKPAKHKILLVGDDPAMCQVLFRLLAGAGFFVLTAVNSDGALELADVMNFDLVLLDFKTQAEEAWETFGRLSAQNPLLPVILIADRPNMFFRALAPESGALLERPLNFTRLFHTIHNLLEETAIKRLTCFAGRPRLSHGIPSEHEASPKVWRTI